MCRSKRIIIMCVYLCMCVSGLFTFQNLRMLFQFLNFNWISTELANLNSRKHNSDKNEKQKSFTHIFQNRIIVSQHVLSLHIWTECHHEWDLRTTVEGNFLVSDDILSFVWLQQNWNMIYGAFCHSWSSCYAYVRCMAKNMLNVLLQNIHVSSLGFHQIKKVI